MYSSSIINQDHITYSSSFNLWYNFCFTSLISFKVYLGVFHGFSYGFKQGFKYGNYEWVVLCSWVFLLLTSTKRCKSSKSLWIHISIMFYAFHVWLGFHVIFSLDRYLLNMIWFPWLCLMLYSYLAWTCVASRVLQ